LAAVKKLPGEMTNFMCLIWSGGELATVTALPMVFGQGAPETANSLPHPLLLRFADSEAQKMHWPVARDRRRVSSSK
jgi:hypothetical protein